MLTLGRQVGESIIIGKDIVVTVKEVFRRQAKVSIQAPPHVKILRSEVAAMSSGETPRHDELVGAISSARLNKLVSAIDLAVVIGVCEREMSPHFLRSPGEFANGCLCGRLGRHPTAEEEGEMDAVWGMCWSKWWGSGGR